MTKLTDTQLVLLSAAANCKDGIIPINERLKGGVARAVGEKLMALGLACEQEVLPPLKGWRVNEEGQKLALVITPKGMQAIGIENEKHGEDVENEEHWANACSRNESCPPLDRTSCNTHPASTTRAASDGTANSPIDPRAPSLNAAPTLTKKAGVIDLLQRADGASIADVHALTGWLPHTTRAALTGLRKKGMEIETVRQAGCATRYRIAPPKVGGDA